MQNKLQKKNSTTAAAWATMLAAGLVLSGCTAGSAGPAAPADGDQATEGYTIGFISGANNEWGSCLQKGIEGAADSEGVELFVANSDGDAVKELSNVEDFISRGVDAIVLNTVSVDALAGGMQRAEDAGIPVYLVAVVPENLDTVLGASVVDLGGVGAIAAGWIAEDAGSEPVNVAIVAGAPGASSDYVVGGFSGALPASATIVAEQPGMFNRGKAQEVTENIVQANPQLDYVFALNEDMAFGVRTALDAAGMQTTKIVTLNGTEPGLAAIEDGTFSATVADSAAALGAHSIMNTIGLLGESGGEKISTMETLLITEANIADAPPFCSI
jgi:ribose transport system substrate-binding protein